MTTRRALERRVGAALDAVPRRIPFVLGACGSGRTSLLRALHHDRGARACQYLDVERSATTPERFYRALISSSPFRAAGSPSVATPRDAFEAVRDFLASARTDAGAPATFLIDEVLEFRTFESFPGLRGLITELFASLAGSQNAFVLTTRYARRAERLLRDPGVFQLMRMPPLGEVDIREIMADGPTGGTHTATPPGAPAPDAARVVQALVDGRAAYVHDVCEEMALLAREGGGDPISALTALLGHDGRLSARCGFAYELRLHRARGYGALKAILDILAHESALTLTEIAQRLHRTPGSTKDYLSWLEDVDLVAMERKRYAFADPVLRLWVRLHCRPVPPHEEEVAREVQRYALERLARPSAEALPATA